MSNVCDKCILLYCGYKYNSDDCKKYRLIPTIKKSINETKKLNYNKVEDIKILKDKIISFKKDLNNLIDFNLKITKSDLNNLLNNNENLFDDILLVLNKYEKLKLKNLKVKKKKHED